MKVLVELPVPANHLEMKASLADDVHAIGAALATLETVLRWPGAVAPPIFDLKPEQQLRLLLVVTDR